LLPIGGDIMPVIDRHDYKNDRAQQRPTSRGMN
jgi:hypothetical protein